MPKEQFAQPGVPSLMIRRRIRASPERLFKAWTDPAQLTQWWGPLGVTCLGAEIDLVVHGRYRIGNQLPDGSVLWIAGEFERIEPPHLLVYTWNLDHLALSGERVTVRFEAAGDTTDVVVLHEHIASAGARITHEIGWQGCLDGLEQFLA